MSKHQTTWYSDSLVRLFLWRWFSSRARVCALCVVFFFRSMVAQVVSVAIEHQSDYNVTLFIVLCTAYSSLYHKAHYSHLTSTLRDWFNVSVMYTFRSFADAFTAQFLLLWKWLNTNYQLKRESTGRPNDSELYSARERCGGERDRERERMLTVRREV